MGPARCWLLVLCASPLLAQRGTGELRLSVRDPAGLALEASIEISSQLQQIRLSGRADREGRYIAHELPFGAYRVRVQHPGFGIFSELVELRSQVPLAYSVVLGVAPIETTIVVKDETPLLDAAETGSVSHIGPETLRERSSAQPARALLDLVLMQPGWVAEANGVLHPRGSEYDTQYVIDGVPLIDNRSPALAPGLDVEELQSLRVLTANYPAEYGRKLGGVIEVVTSQDHVPGFHGKGSLEGGSFGTASGYLAAHYARGRTAAGLSIQGVLTDRYLDPPVQENLMNHASSSGATSHFERDWTDADRLRLYFHHKRTGFLVPNEIVQEQAGQRQDRDNAESMGQISYQHIFTPRVMASFRGMVRDLTARLWSNPLATPILAGQDRGFREGYAAASLAAHAGRHEFKGGTEQVWTAVREQFGYDITDPSFFDTDVPPSFHFAGRRRGREQALYAQDQATMGRLTLAAGLRWDSYRLLVRRSAFSPRLGAAWHWPQGGMVFRVSYDRAFQIPAIENLLLASSAAAQSLTANSTGVAVPPSLANFYQAGFSKSLIGRLRLDAQYFRRAFQNFADDDVLLNTGVSFPIAFSRAEIHGWEGRLELPRWGPVSGFASYSNMVGTGYLPITGGLLLEKDSAGLLRSTDRFSLTQDQRNTAHARLRVQLPARVWLAIGAWYGSGLPVELETGTAAADLAGFYSAALLERVNFERGRVRPSHAVDLSGGVEIWGREKRALRLQGGVQNLTNRLNLINFAGIFSGTALAPPRSFAVRMETEF